MTWPNLADNSFHDSISTGFTFVITGNRAGLNTPSGQIYTAQNVNHDTTFTFTPANSGNGYLLRLQTNPATEFEWFARASTCNGSPCVPPMLDNSLATITSWVKTATFRRVPVSFPPGGVVPAARLSELGWTGFAGRLRVALLGHSTAAHHLHLRQGYSGIHLLDVERVLSAAALHAVESPADHAHRYFGHLVLEEHCGGLRHGGYSPPTDQFLLPGVVPRSVGSSMFSAVCAGAAALRPYQFEDPNYYTLHGSRRPGRKLSVDSAAPFTAPQSSGARKPTRGL